jgi:tRNA(fMet)-specific endonuclease VapC
MLILDTNHYSEIEKRTSLGIRLSARLRESGDEGFLTIITPAEILKGWLAAINRPKQADRCVSAFDEFQNSLKGFQEWIALPWSEDAADLFDHLRRQGVSIGTMDLRIACIALEYNATVLTRNFADFKKVPGLKVENWLD